MSQAISKVTAACTHLALCVELYVTHTQIPGLWNLNTLVCLHGSMRLTRIKVPPIS